MFKFLFLILSLRFPTNFIESAARHYLSKAFDKLIFSRQGSEAIEAMVHALGCHKRPNETLEIMDFGKDFYASAYFRSAISFLNKNEIAQAQVIYKKSGGKLGYHSSRVLAFQYNWKSTKPDAKSGVTTALGATCYIVEKREYSS